MGIGKGMCAFYGSFGWDRLLAHFCGGTKDKGKENTENKVGEMRSKRFNSSSSSRLLWLVNPESNLSRVSPTEINEGKIGVRLNTTVEGPKGLLAE
jgi:hypothetical protein